MDFSEIITHTGDDDCAACEAQSITTSFLMPAAAAWEMTHELPRFSLAIHGAAGLLGVMLEEGIARREVEAALSQLLDEIEQRIEEDRILGGPTQGSA